MSRENFSCSNSLLRFNKQRSSNSLFAVSSSAVPIVFKSNDNYLSWEKKLPHVWPSTLRILIFLYIANRCVRLSSRYSYFFGKIRSNHVNTTEQRWSELLHKPVSANTAIRYKFKNSLTANRCSISKQL